MTFRLKLLFAIAPWLALVAPSIATEFTYKEYAKASEDWKRGFVFGMSQYMQTVAQPDEEAPYQLRNAYERCFAASTDVMLVRQVEAFVVKDPAGLKDPMVRVVIRALFDLCRKEIEKLPKAPPRK
jgi:hypothetical protein